MVAIKGQNDVLDLEMYEQCLICNCIAMSGRYPGIAAERGQGGMWAA